MGEQFSVLLPERPSVAPSRPPGRHRARRPGQVVFEHVVAAPVHGSGSERIASPGCPDRTIRRRVGGWAEAGVGRERHALAQAQYDRMIGLDLTELAVDGCITKGPGCGERAGQSPVDRGKQGLKRSTATDAAGPTLAGLAEFDPSPATSSIHINRGQDSGVTRTLLGDLGFAAEIARKDLPVPFQARLRWVVERTQARMNGVGKLRRCTERTGAVVNFDLFHAAAFVVARMLIHRARVRYLWPRPVASRDP